MPKLSKREMILLTILFITIIGYCYYTYLLTPQLNNLDTMKQKLETDKVMLSQLQASQKNIEDIKKEVADLNSKVEASEKSIPDASRIPEIIMDFKTIADASGCEVKGLSFNPPVSGSSENSDQNENSQKNVPGIMVIPLTYQSSGSYNNILLLIKSIENSARKMTIEKISLKEDREAGILTADLSINCYYLNKSGQQKIDYSFLNTPSGKQDIFN